MSEKTTKEVTLIAPTDIEAVKDHYALFEQLKKEMLIPEVDYGTIPGVKKKSLFKAGGEKLVKLFNLYPSDIELTYRDVDLSTGFVNFEYKVFLLNAAGTIVSSGVGSCNSFEEKYLYYWAEKPQPERHVQLEMKAKRIGRNRKYMEKWVWQERTKKAPEELIALKNTIQKMAKKRAFLDAVLMGLGGSQSLRRT